MATTSATTRIRHTENLGQRLVHRYRAALGHRSEEVRVQPHECAPAIIGVDRGLDGTPLAKTSDRRLAMYCARRSKR